MAMLLGVFMMARFMMPHIYTTIRGYLVWIITGIGGDVAQLLSPQLLTITVISLLKCVLPLLLTAVVLGILSHGAQTRFNVAFQALQPRFSKLNPITGIKNLFSLKKVVELLKNLIKISLLLALLYNLLKGDIVPVARMSDMNPVNSAAYMMNMVFNLVIKICMAFTVVAFFDFLYQRWEYERDLKMTKQEVKDEYKQTEGNPEIKGRIRRIQRQMALSRMIQRVPQADVIVRNPTHFAVALKYDPDKSGAPIVLAKGRMSLRCGSSKQGRKMA